MRRYIKLTLRNISRLRLQPCSDWQNFVWPIGRYRALSIFALRVGRMPMENYTVFGTLMIFGYGVQLRRKGYA